MLCCSDMGYIPLVEDADEMGDISSHVLLIELPVS